MKNNIIVRQVLLVLFPLLLSGIGRLQAQEQRTEFCVDFPLGVKTLDPQFKENAFRLNELTSFFNKVNQDSTLSIQKITLSGVASPEGSYEINKDLAFQRLKSLESYLEAQNLIPDNVSIEYLTDYVDWQRLGALVKESDYPKKAEILSILEMPEKKVPYRGNSTIDSRVLALQKLENGLVWKGISEHHFSQIRQACAIVVTLKSEKPLPVEEEPAAEEIVTDTIPAVSEPVMSVVEPKESPRNLYVKVNTVGLAMLLANAAIEYQWSDHWSVSVPVYYSAANYFHLKTKFRTTCIQPELRYWFPRLKGFYVNAHFGLAWYNVALKGNDFRYQDHEGGHPLFGGGIGFGYRKPISKNQRWFMEFSLGAGAYKLHYDRFRNEENGKLVDTQTRTFWGIDNVSVSFAYRFDLKKKGGKR